jgi:hypothetical protein
LLSVFRSQLSFVSFQPVRSRLSLFRPSSLIFPSSFILHPSSFLILFVCCQFSVVSFSFRLHSLLATSSSTDFSCCHHAMEFIASTFQRQLAASCHSLTVFQKAISPALHP